MKGRNIQLLCIFIVVGVIFSVGWSDVHLYISVCHLLSHLTAAVSRHDSGSVSIRRN